MFEYKSKAVISKSAFISRMFKWLLCTIFLLLSSLFFGILGYHYFENLSWIDSLLNAAMIFGGMGEIDILHTNGGKIFAALYAIYSGLLLVVCGSLLLVPVFHRILHKFHADK